MERRGRKDISHCYVVRIAIYHVWTTTHHSLSTTDRVSTALSSMCPACDWSFSLVRCDTSVTVPRISRASFRGKAGFFVFTGRIGGTLRLRLRIQKTHRLFIVSQVSLYGMEVKRGGIGEVAYNGAAIATTNTGTRNAKAVGVMPDWPTVLRHSLAWSEAAPA